MPTPSDINFFNTKKEIAKGFEELPETLAEAKELALLSDFVKAHLPQQIINIYCK